MRATIDYITVSIAGKYKQRYTVKPDPNQFVLYCQDTAPPPLPPHNLGQAQVYTHSEGISYSQPEMRQPALVEEGNYVNVAAIRSYNHNIYNSNSTENNYYALRGGMAGKLVCLSVSISLFLSLCLPLLVSLFLSLSLSIRRRILRQCSCHT